MAKKRTGQGALFCVICGEAALKDESVCPGCGSPYEGEARFCGQNPYGAGGIGYSDRAKDKTFRRNNRKTLVGTLIAMLVISALIAGFLLLSGQLTADADGLKILGGIMAILWAFWIIWIVAQNLPHKGWEGVVERKYQQLQERRRSSDTRGHYIERRMEYAVVFRLNGKKTKKCSEYDKTLWYDYLKEGDRVLYHGKGMNYYEKYDKSRDTVIPCSSCSSLRDARENYCERCGAVILKGQPVSAPAPAPAYEPQLPPQSPAVPAQEDAGAYRSAPVRRPAGYVELEGAQSPAGQPVQTENRAPFCPGCGAPVTGSKFCSNCGQKLV